MQYTIKYYSYRCSASYKFKEYHSRFDLPCEGAKNTNGWLHAFA